ncbi:MAG TPA: rod shape-determining protein MreC [Longimicrobiales bacterium]|nr:rod shape-determining protein MreC [Longimicrobiales bacterium]
MPPYTSQDTADDGSRLEFRTTLGVVAVALVLVNLPASYQESLAAALRGTVLRPFLAVQEGLVAARARAEAAAVLQARIDSLTAVTVGQTTLSEENRRLRGLLDLSSRLGPRWMAVQVLRPGTTDSESMLIVDAGTRQGMARRSPIITREGLAGVVREAYSDYAVGMDWTHPEFRASAMTLDGLQYGMVRSDRGIFREQTRLKLEGLPFHARVDSGTAVVTSGLGGVFPRGIPIGRIVGVAEEEAEWRKSYWLEPQVAVGSVTLALVALEGSEPLDEMTAGWEGLGYLRAEEWVIREQALADSVRRLRDSLAVLERRLAPETDGGGG